MTDREQLIKELLDQGKSQREAEETADELLRHYGDRPGAEIADPAKTFQEDNE